jgi:hypothetical protein
MEDMNHTDRSRRLQIALDPSTSLAALLELAMEFPEAVAANPALPVALAADPTVVESAHVVALACLLTSPNLPVIVGTVLEGIVARTCDPHKRRTLGEYLEEWRHRGSRRVSTLQTQPAACAQGLEVSIERLTRGQALLAQRLGWQKCRCWYSTWDKSDSSVEWGLGDGVEHESDLAIFLPNWRSVFLGHCLWWVDLIKGPTAQVELLKSPGRSHARFELSSDTASLGELAWSNYDMSDQGDLNLTPSVDAVQRVVGLLGPWLESARRAEPEQIIVVGLKGKKLRMANADVGQIRQAARDASENDFDEDDESDDEDAESPTTLAELMGGCLSARDWEDSDFDSFFDALEDAGGTRVQVDGADAAAGIFRQAFEDLIPRARVDRAGSFKLPKYQIAFLERGGDVSLTFGEFCWCNGHSKQAFDLDASSVV